MITHKLGKRKLHIKAVCSVISFLTSLIYAYTHVLFVVCLILYVTWVKFCYGVFALDSLCVACSRPSAVWKNLSASQSCVSVWLLQHCALWSPAEAVADVPSSISIIVFVSALLPATGCEIIKSSWSNVNSWGGFQRGIVLQRVPLLGVEPGVYMLRLVGLITPDIAIG